jgi:hypothetical protein
MKIYQTQGTMTTLRAITGIFTVIAVIGILGACIPIKQEIVVVPQSRGEVRDGITGEPLPGVAIEVIRHATLGAMQTEPVLSGADGAFLLPLRMQQRTLWMLPTAGNIYRSSVSLRARHVDYADAYGLVAYVFPDQMQTEDTVLFLFTDLATLPETAPAGCLDPREHHAYTLALALEKMAGTDWFTDLMAQGDRRYALLEYLRNTLRGLTERCQLPWIDVTALLSD